MSSSETGSHGAVWGDSHGGRDARASALAAHGFMLRLSATMEGFEAESE
jgi:hypothetical protein